MMKPLYFFSILCFLLFGSSFQELNAQSWEEVGIAQQGNGEAIVVAYSGMNKGTLVVKSKDMSVQIKHLTFYSILGAEVAHYSVNANSGEVSLDKLRPGKYLMKYTLSNNTQKVIQIIKQ